MDNKRKNSAACNEQGYEAGEEDRCVIEIWRNEALVWAVGGHFPLLARSVECASEPERRQIGFNLERYGRLRARTVMTCQLISQSSEGDGQWRLPIGQCNTNSKEKAKVGHLPSIDREANVSRERLEPFNK